MQTYDIKDLGPGFILQNLEALTIVLKPGGQGQVLPADNPPWEPVLFAKERRI